MKVSDIIVEFLEKKEIRTVFGYPGGNVVHLLDSIYRNGKIKYAQGYNEQAIAFAADGYARTSDGIGVAMASSGPGSTNMITAIADAWFDSIPCVFLCGYVSLYDKKTNPELRQNGFQEADIVPIVRSITKYAAMVDRGEDILFCLEKAFHESVSGRKGPVLLELPHNIQAMEVEVAALRHFEASFVVEKVAEDEIENVVTSLCEANKPVFLIGAGLHKSKALEIVMELGDKLHIPIVSSMAGLGMVPSKHKRYYGFIGTFGMPRANMAIKESDFLLVAGCRLEGQHIGNKLIFAENAEIVHVDIDATELDNFSRSKKIKCTADYFFEKIKSLLQVRESVAEKNENWCRYLRTFTELYDSAGEKSSLLDSPYACLKHISGLITGKKAVCADVGQHLIWTAQSFEFNKGDRFLVSGGLGSMGFALPAAIGASFVNDKSTIVCVIGDGGLQMNLQELQTIRKYALPIKLIVINNNGLGMVRAYQEKFFGHNLGSQLEYLPCPNFAKLAEAFCIEYKQIRNDNDMKGLKGLLNNGQAVMLEIITDRDCQVYSGILEV